MRPVLIAVLILSMVGIVLATAALAQTVTLAPDGSPRGRRTNAWCDAGVTCNDPSPAGQTCGTGSPGFAAGGCKATAFVVEAMPGQTILGGTAEYWACEAASDAGWAHNVDRDKTIADGGTRSQAFGPYSDPAGLFSSRVHIRLVNGIRNALGDGGVITVTERCCLQGEGC